MPYRTAGVTGAFLMLTACAGDLTVSPDAATGSADAAGEIDQGVRDDDGVRADDTGQASDSGHSGDAAEAGDAAGADAVHGALDADALDDTAQPPDPTCSDGVANGSETGIDCGGPACPKCADGSGCLLGTDCTSLVCANRRCAVPTCTDTVRNGTETDIDCGGVCVSCSGIRCRVDTDCWSGSCKEGQCIEPTCSDGIKNGTESDTDCGGVCQGCRAGAHCYVDFDCADKTCVGNVCQTNP